MSEHSVKSTMATAGGSSIVARTEKKHPSQRWENCGEDVGGVGEFFLYVLYCRQIRGSGARDATTQFIGVGGMPSLPALGKAGGGGGWQVGEGIDLESIAPQQTKAKPINVSRPPNPHSPIQPFSNLRWSATASQKACILLSSTLLTG